MNRELKKAIINWMFDNYTLFNRHYATIANFRAYIYDSEGNYLIGGEDVAKFINDADNLI